MKTLRKISDTCLSLGMAVLLAGCSTRSPLKRGALQSEWATTFRELGIVPAFPPREDLMVGDIYLLDYDPNSADAEKIFLKPWKDLTEGERVVRQSMGMSTRAMRLDLQQKTSDAYLKTLSAPPTTAEYNSILGNPAVAAAAAEVDRIAAEIKALEDTIASSEKKNAEAVKAHTTATQEKAKIDADLAAAKAELAAVKPVDVTAEETAAADAQERVWAVQRNLVLAKDEQKKVADDKAKKPIADAEVAKLELERDLALHDQTVANARLAKAKTKSADTSALQQKVDELTKKQTESAAKVLDLDQQKSNSGTDLTNLKAATQPKIEALKPKLTKAEDVKRAVGEAGAKLLYPEPTFGAENLFLGQKLADPVAHASNSSRINRLRLVAFPEFSASSVSAADLSALVPVDALGVGLNVSTENVSQISVKIPAAESYAISLTDIYPEIIDAGTGTKLSSKVQEIMKIAKVLYPSRPPTSPPEPGRISKFFGKVKTGLGVKPEPPPPAKERDIVYLRVVTEVFYARAMDIGIFASKSFGGRASVNSPSKTEDGKDAEKGFTDAATPTSSALLAQIAERVSTTQPLPGGSIQLLSKNESSIGIRRVFDRPVAVGWRGLVLKVKTDGALTGVASNDGGYIPMVPP